MTIRSMRAPLIASVALATLAFSSGPAWAEPAVVDVNKTLLNTIRASAATTPPPRAARAIGMVGIAMFDAVNASSGSSYNPYAYQGGAVSGLSQDAVALASGYTMMANLFPTLSTTLTTELNGKLGALAITDAQRASSLAFGQTVANNLFAARANDGSATAQYPYVAGTGLGDFQPTQATNPVLPGWGQVATFGVQNGAQFDVGPPPAVGSAEWIADYNQVKSLGCSTCGTADTQLIAKYWADGGGTFTPPGHWLDIATGMMQDLSTMEAAKLTALVGASVADAGITSWNTKYLYDVFRPVTAIQTCTLETCGVEGDPSWTPLLATPNFPSYTSGHSTFSGGGAGALTGFFGTDAVMFCTPADPRSGIQGERCFASFSEAAKEAGMSRIYGGIHYEFDNTRAVAAGTSIGTYISENHFRINDANNYTGYDGIISGTRGLTIVAGRELLSGANTYTGRTTISSSATLALLGTGSIEGSSGITANGVFDISATTSGTTVRSLAGTGSVALGSKQLVIGNAADTFAGNISGTGALRLDAGTLTLSGQNALTGATTVAGGRLNVTGSLASSAVTANSGTVVGGTGTVGALTAKSGAAVAPGMSIGTLAVNGDLVLEYGSVLDMEVSPTGADRINVSGAARLGGTLQVSPASGAYQFNSSHTLVSASTVTGSFDAVTGLGGFGSLFDPIVTLTGQAVLLRLRPVSLATLAGPAAGSNGAAVAAAFDRAARADSNPYNPQPFLALYTQGANLANALEQLSGEVHSAERRVALEDTRVVREAAFDRINSATISPSALQTAAIGKGEREATMWLRGLGNWSTAKADGRGAEFKTEQQGFLAGIDTTLSSGIKIGAMLISTETDINFATLGRSRVSNTGGALYAGFHAKRLNLGFGASYADTGMVANRSITIPGLEQSLRGETSGTTSQLFAEAAYDFNFGAGSKLTPFGRIAAASTKVESFAETGGIAALVGTQQNHEITVANLGVRGAFKAGPATITGAAAWQRTDGDRAIGSMLAIADVNQLATVHATALDKDAAALEAMSSLAIGKTSTIGIGYTGIIGARNVNHGARATLSVGF